MAQCECLQNMQEDLGLISSFKIKGKQTLLAAMKKREKEELILEGLVLFCFVFFPNRENSLHEIDETLDERLKRS